MTASRTGVAARHFIAIAGSAIFAFAVAACGGSGEDPEGTPSSASATESASSAKSPDESHLAEVNGAQFTAPADWTVEQGQARVTISAPKDDGGYSPGFGLLDADLTLAESTEALASDTMKTSGAKRLADVEFGGVTFFHVREGNETNTFDTYGAVIGDSEVTVAWTFINDFASPKQIDDLVNQVMPSFKFEG